MLLTRSPLEYPRRGLSVRLACVKHAASVRPEPGSNSPQKISPIKDQPGFVKSPTKTGKKTNNQQKNNPLIIHQKNNEKSKAKNSDHRCLDETTQQPPNTHTHTYVTIVCSHGIPHHNPHRAISMKHNHVSHKQLISSAQHFYKQATLAGQNCVHRDHHIKHHVITHHCLTTKRSYHHVNHKIYL